MGTEWSRSYQPSIETRLYAEEIRAGRRASLALGLCMRQQVLEGGCIVVPRNDIHSLLSVLLETVFHVRVPIDRVFVKHHAERSVLTG